MPQHTRFGLPGRTKIGWHSGTLPAPLGPIVRLSVAVATKLGHSTRLHSGTRGVSRDLDQSEGLNSTP
eukprot:7569035-Pyramimonas_sp.AAC.1